MEEGLQVPCFPKRGVPSECQHDLSSAPPLPSTRYMRVHAHVQQMQESAEEGKREIKIEILSLGMLFNHTEPQFPLQTGDDLQGCGED